MQIQIPKVISSESAATSADYGGCQSKAFGNFVIIYSLIEFFIQLEFGSVCGGLSPITFHSMCHWSVTTDYDEWRRQEQRNLVSPYNQECVGRDKS